MGLRFGMWEIATLGFADILKDPKSIHSYLTIITTENPFIQPYYANETKIYDPLGPSSYGRPYPYWKWTLASYRCRNDENARR
jgi:hypothetical protein